VNFRIPKNNDKYFWTMHSIEKMRFYGLSEQKILGVVRRPQRKEDGVVKNTVAVMQPISPKTDKDGKKTWKTEIWVMYQASKAENSKLKATNPKQITNHKFQNLQKLLNLKQVQDPKFQKLLTINQKLKIISAWRYPGVSPEKNPIPQDILREIEDQDLNEIDL
jgi:hypothetical protein